MRLYQILGVFILFVATQAAEQSAVVTEGKINVRGRPSLIGEVITQLERGEKVTVLERITNSTADPGEPTNWAKIKLPPNTPVWVFAPFVKDGKVSVSRLNVRAGRGENYSVIGRLNRDEEVKPIRTVEEWMEIEQPTNAYAFVDISLLQIEGEPTAPAVVAQPGQKTKDLAGTESGTANQPDTVASATPTTSEQPSVPPDNAQETPAAKAPSTTASAATPANSETVPKETAVSTPEATSQPETAAVSTPEPVPGTQPEQVATTPEPSIAITPEQPATSPLPATENLPQVAPPVVTRSEPPPKRVVRREGIVRATSSIQAPTWYELVHADTKKRINYLFEENMGINLKDYRGQKVVVSGEEAIDPRWPNTPILDMQTLDVLPNDR